jgi:secernin
MCDTIVAQPSCAAERILLFGKNSDRERNEAQSVECFPRADHPRGARQTCTHITIPQARHTHAILVCRPFWIWGAEMGANEHGVVIGNEGLHARRQAAEESALTGMDLVRLALERAATAAEAVDVITTLLEQYGQGGNCGHLVPSYYNNGFMIADPSDAFVLETIGREWLIERAHGLHAISNCYGITEGAYRTSAGLAALVRDFGWSGDAPTNYADLIGDRQKEHLGQARSRLARSTSLLHSRGGQLRAADFMSILRDHASANQPNTEWSHQGSIPCTLCMHAGPEGRDGQTTCAMVSEIRPKDSMHWVTGTAAPCISIFKPVLMDVPLPSRGPAATGYFDSAVLWWRHERLHRAALMGDFCNFVDNISQERDALEAEFHARMTCVVNGGSRMERAQVVAECWREAIETEDRWLERVNRAGSIENNEYCSAWSKMNRLAGMDVYLPKRK